MSGISLQELIDSVGINKKELAKILGVTPKTVQRMGDLVSDEVLATIEEYKNNITSEQSEKVPTPVDSTCIANQEILDEVDFPSSKILPVTHENIAMSRLWYGREGMPIDQVADKFGMTVFAYNQAVQNTIIHCQDNNTSFMELRGNE